MRSVILSNEIMLPEVAKMLSEGKQVTIRAKGNSMLPFIVGGQDNVVLERKKSYAVGDIVLAEISPKLFVLHRILKIDDAQVTLMGDGNISGMEKCRKENICGRAIAIIHKGKQIDCNSKRARRKARLWKILLPGRRYLLAIYRRIV
ncbi:MAG: S24/S26 family peptidase [Proteiniphilum sp.]|jgi:SOS-response transcriptional repressor LexA|uniref:S24/S26 family peptidase n=1 Tax=Proteiniphilum sp. TaxID=1926877 RepID=UPI002B1FCB0F|nr:S24/S26 family peptidase [Proteiniphilum sp.]MEA5127407.1 S24/S26 family peptidase [Proteiniphilum sp.]